MESRNAKVVNYLTETSVIERLLLQLSLSANSPRKSIDFLAQITAQAQIGLLARRAPQPRFRRCGHDMRVSLRVPRTACAEGLILPKAIYDRGCNGCRHHRKQRVILNLSFVRIFQPPNDITLLQGIEPCEITCFALHGMYWVMTTVDNRHIFVPVMTYVIVASCRFFSSDNNFGIPFIIRHFTLLMRVSWVNELQRACKRNPTANSLDATSVFPYRTFLREQPGNAAATTNVHLRLKVCLGQQVWIDKSNHHFAAANFVSRRHCQGLFGAWFQAKPGDLNCGCDLGVCFAAYHKSLNVLREKRRGPGRC